MNVNLDVLELIFGQLDGADLVASSLVCRAFLAGAIPSLYAHIEYTTHHAKRAHRIISPFATLAAHHHLVVHVKRIAVHSAPLSSTQPCPVFLHDLEHSLRTATNLRSFVCTVKILPALLPCLLHKPSLNHLRICAPLGSRQVAVLEQYSGLHSLSFDLPSWNVIDAMPAWTASMQKTLAHLTLFMSQDIDATVLNAILAGLPRLRGLHVIGCPRITHSAILKALSHTPDLRELSLSIFPSQEIALPLLNFPIPPLTHLAIDIRASYLGLKPLLARIISRLSPRDALAICGGWIGEVRGSSEHIDPPQNTTNGHGGPGPGDAGGPLGNLHVWQSHPYLHVPHHPHGHAHAHPDGQANDPLLLTSPVPHSGNAHPTQPNQGNFAPPPNFAALPLPLPLGNLNGNNNNNIDPPGAGPNPPNPDPNPDPSLPSLISALPSTLSILHLPQISPAGLREVVDRCQGIRILGIIIGNTFAPSEPSKASKLPHRVKEPIVRSCTRPEVNVLANILSRARALRELIIDATLTEIGGSGWGTDARASGSHGASFGGCTLFTPASARMLMRDSPCLRRIVSEGRVWESTTPIPSSPTPSPHCLVIDLVLTKASYGPGTGNGHAHGPPGFGTIGGGYAQVEASNDHWFWLTGSASGSKVNSRF